MSAVFRIIRLFRFNIANMSDITRFQGILKDMQKISNLIKNSTSKYFLKIPYLQILISGHVKKNSDVNKKSLNMSISTNNFPE